MNESKNPSEIAREALKQLVVRHLPPTPANFQASYNEIAKLPNQAPFPEPQLRQFSHALLATSPPEKKALDALDVAIGRRSWQGVQDALLAYLDAVRNPAGLPSVAAVEPVEPVESTLTLGLAGKLARLVECTLPALGDESPRLGEQASALLQTLRQPPFEISALQSQLEVFSRQVLFAAEEQAEIKDALLKLIHLIIESIGELTLEDSWFKGQIDGLLAVVEPPLTLRHLDEMERRLRDVMAKQSEAKLRSVAAQEEMREMLSAFISRLSTMNESSHEFQEKMESSARQIEQVRCIEDLAPLLKEVIGATRNMVEETAQARDQLQSLQTRVLATEAELIQLHMELDTASALARHDPLTDALNRKGLDEALAREIANVQRKDAPLSICLLDIDNFKLLNDRLGHETGDKALVHLAGVTRHCMRPTDTLARYGGEEFVILMPDTAIESGIEVMTRLQRELTKAFFLSGKEKILITFSAGVAQLMSGESGSDAINRADQAMYLAKRAGKNRVMGA